MDVAELEELAQELVVRVRDDAMESNERWLKAQLPDQYDWLRLAFVLACAVPDDRSWRVLTAWTEFGSGPPATWQVRDLQPHGTRAAYQRHLAHGEEPCEDCAFGAKEYERLRGRRRRSRGAA